MPPRYAHCSSAMPTFRPATRTAPPPSLPAAYGNHIEAARLLVEAEADVNAKDESEQSAYLIATSEVGT